MNEGTKNIFLPALLIIVLVAAAFIFWQFREALITFNQSEERYQEAPEDRSYSIREKKIHEEIDEKKFSLDLSVPELTGYGAAEFNAAIEKSIVAPGRAFGVEIEAFEDFESTYSCEYEKRIENSNILNFLFKCNQYAAGAAHPLFFYKTLLYDVQNKKEVRLSELFRDQNGYLNALSQLARKELRLLVEKGEFGTDEESITRGLTPDAANFENFTITKEFLQLHFPPYQVGAYAAGPVSVDIKRLDLEPYFSDRGKQFFVSL